MMGFLYFMDFLYFPEDKTEYIPAVITLFIFMVGAGYVTFLFYRKSKKEEKRFNEKFDKDGNFLNNHSSKDK